MRPNHRRLRREIHKLETEVNYLRTQPPKLGGIEATRSEQRKGGGVPPPAGGRELPSAPVYGGDAADERPSDDDDDVYSGGRAV